MATQHLRRTKLVISTAIALLGHFILCASPEACSTCSTEEGPHKKGASQAASTGPRMSDTSERFSSLR